MSLKINLNTSALNAHRSLSSSDSRLSKSIERLSSGYKINNAGDDPAGLVISEKLRAQVSGLAQAITNANDAVNMVRTAEGALNEVHTMLRSMRDLAIHAANTGATDAASAQADQAQINNSISSLNKIASETQFGNRNLLDGSAGTKTYINGSKVMAGDFSFAQGLSTNSDILVSVTQAATQATISLSAGNFGAVDGSFYVNGVKVEYAAGDTNDVLINKINAKSELTGATAVLNTTTGFIDVKSNTYGSLSKLDITSGSVILGVGINSATANGTDAQATVTKVVGETVSNVSDQTWASGDGLTLKDSVGNTIILTTAGGTTTSAATSEFKLEVNNLTFQVGAYAGQTREVSINSVFAHCLGNGAVADMNVSNIDLTTADGAQDAIKVLDKAITDISGIRANLGATQTNVLESSINSLSIAKENLSSSESAIRDTDMAAEMIEYSKNQILQQAGISMLAQANSSSQQLLSLLQG